MKKIIVLLSILIVFVTGCSVRKLHQNNIGKNIEYLLDKKVNLANVYYDGYKYYLPKGVRFIEKDDYNAVVKDMRNNRYYIFVDAISYFHKVKNTYKENDDSYYCQKLNIQNKTGYIQIDKVDSKYFVQFVYHYMKIEAYVVYKDLDDTISNMSQILRSVKYNDKILASLIGENKLSYKEEDFTLFKADSSKESFLDVVEREETDKYKEDIEDEKIDLDY